MEITDEMLRAAVRAMDEQNRIQGFSSPQNRNRTTWGPPYWVMDYGQRPARELWRGDSHNELMERCDMERLRIGIEAMLSKSTGNLLLSPPLSERRK
jgi:hypothetical protein